MKSWPAFIADWILSSGAAGVPHRKRSDNGTSTPYRSRNRPMSSPSVPVEVDGRVILLRRCVERDRLAVVEKLALGPGAVHQGAQLVRTLDVHVGRRRVLQLLTVGQDALTGQFGRHAKALQRLQVRPHVLERLDRRLIDGVRCRLGAPAGAACALASGAATEIASSPSTRIVRSMVISRLGKHGSSNTVRSGVFAEMGAERIKKGKRF